MKIKTQVLLYGRFVFVTFLCSCTARKSANEVKNIGIETGDGESYESFRQEYVTKYDEKLVIDTTSQARDTLDFKLTHYALYDTLVIPSKYSWSDTPEDFSTHSFVSRIVIVQAGQAVVDTLIDKTKFAGVLPPELNSYGVLLYPVFRGFDGNFFTIQYSISIPLTDIGRGVIFRVNVNGEIEITED